ncbi:unnamed protein product, partial [Scytosiphon promiscuus]
CRCIRQCKHVASRPSVGVKTPHWSIASRYKQNIHRLNYATKPDARTSVYHVARTCAVQDLTRLWYRLKNSLAVRPAVTHGYMYAQWICHNTWWKKPVHPYSRASEHRGHARVLHALYIFTSYET